MRNIPTVIQANPTPLTIDMGDLVEMGIGTLFRVVNYYPCFYRTKLVLCKLGCNTEVSVYERRLLEAIKSGEYNLYKRANNYAC